MQWMWALGLLGAHKGIMSFFGGHGSSKLPPSPQAPEAPSSERYPNFSAQTTRKTEGEEGARARQSLAPPKQPAPSQYQRDFQAWDLYQARRLPVFMWLLFFSTHESIGMDTASPEIRRNVANLRSLFWNEFLRLREWPPLFEHFTTRPHG